MADTDPVRGGQNTTVVCPSCHMEVSKWERTCRFCGEDLASATAESDPGNALGEEEAYPNNAALLSAEREPDKLRLCPSCRMRISILAVKCRYCGEEVGRPRAEQRSLTIRDLGGETVMHAAPSRSVVEALQAFREEEHASLREHATPVVQRKHAAKSSQQSQPAAAVQLDSAHASLATIAAESRPFAFIGDARRSFGWIEYVRPYLYGLAGVLALCIVGFCSYLYLHRPAEAPDVPENMAKSMLARGVPIVETLKVAEQYNRRYPSTESEAVLEQARARLKSEVDRLVNMAPFSMDSLRDASALASDAQRIDPGMATMGLVEEVAREVRAYCSMLVDVDSSEPPVARIRVTNKDRTVSEVKVREGETFYDGRFKVDAVSLNGIDVEDTMRNGRRLRITRTAGMIPM